MVHLYEVLMMSSCAFTLLWHRSFNASFSLATFSCAASLLAASAASLQKHSLSIALRSFLARERASLVFAFHLVKSAGRPLSMAGDSSRCSADMAGGGGPSRGEAPMWRGARGLGAAGQ